MEFILPSQNSYFWRILSLTHTQTYGVDWFIDAFWIAQSVRALNNESHIFLYHCNFFIEYYFFFFVVVLVICGFATKSCFDFNVGSLIVSQLSLGLVAIILWKVLVDWSSLISRGYRWFRRSYLGKILFY